MQFQPVQTEYFPFKGGLNQVTPALSIPPGMLIDSMNYEPEVSGGYRRIAGYERYDGRTSPSSADYWLIACTISGTIAAGNTVTGATSGASGAAVQVNAAELVLTKVTGTFQSGENLQVSAVTQAVATGTANKNSASTPALHAAYKNLAADNYRADIQTVPGSGDVLGVALYNGTVYAWRNNAGGTAAVMHKKTASGWSAITLYNEISFTVGATGVDEGDTLTQGANTATIKRIVLTSGTFAAGTAAGRLIVTTPAPGNFAAGAATTTGGGTLTLSGAQTAITLAIGGRYETVNYNFTGSTSTYRMYGCDGVTRAFEFDSTGDILVPVSTGMTTDTPKFIACHKNRLFLSFRGSLQYSTAGLPYQWTVLTGANEIGVGDEITGLLPQPGDNSTSALAVFSRNSTNLFYGSSASDFQMVNLSNESGCIAYSAQNIGHAYAMDDRGLVQIGATQEYGNFQHATISQLIQPLIDDKRGLVVASSINRTRNQYRVYFSDGTGIIFGFSGKKLIGAMPFDYGKEATCICSGEDTDGTEKIFFGSTDGYVYQAEKGTSFDGSDIEAWIRPAFNHSKSPRGRKRYRKAIVELTTDGVANISVTQDLSYGNPDIYPEPSQTLAIAGGGGYWDQFYWDDFAWDSQVIPTGEIGMIGTGTNASLTFHSKNDYDQPWTIQGVILHYQHRRQER